MHILLAFYLMVLNMKNKTWQKTPSVSRGVLLVIVFNAIYYLLCRRRMLWDFQTIFLRKRAVRFLHVLIITPLAVSLFLSRLPREIMKRLLYFIRWIAVSVAIEWLGHKKFNMIVFKNGWNLKWSMFVYMKLYAFSMLALKRPWLAWFLSSLSAMFYVVHFHIPVKETMRGYYQALLSANTEI